MNVFNTTQRSWQLFKSAIFVIRKYPRLVLFPLLTAGFTLLIAAFFMAPVIVIAVQHPPAPNAGPAQTLATYPQWMMYYSLLLYPISMFCATFCNVAFYSQVMAALNGQPVSIRRGLCVATSRLKSILIWSLFAGIIGAIIREVESRLGFIGRIVAGLVGFAWSVACVFVVPVIIREEPTGNPIDILRKSSGTIKRTWGEALVGYVGVGILNLIAGVIIIVTSLVTMFIAISLSNYWILLPVGVIMILGIVAYGCIIEIASRSYLCALYIYATEGVIPEPYDQSLLDQAWKIRKD